MSLLWNRFTLVWLHIAPKHLSPTSKMRGGSNTWWNPTSQIFESISLKSIYSRGERSFLKRGSTALRLRPCLCLLVTIHLHHQESPGTPQPLPLKLASLSLTMDCLEFIKTLGQFRAVIMEVQTSRSPPITHE